MSFIQRSENLQIVRCCSASDARKFERVAEELHGTDPAFVPPFPGSIAKFLSQDCAFQKHHGKIIGFLGIRNGRVVGRIAAIINRSHNTYYQDRTGFIGFFESENSRETAEALFQAAVGVLREAGMESVRATYNPSINDDCGILLNGFSKFPTVGLPWNPGYYPALFESTGWVRVRSLFTLHLPMHRLELPQRLSRITERLKKRESLTMRTFDLSKLQEELKIVRDVYNATLERNWGFVPIEMADLLASADDFRAIADPELLLIGMCRGREAGVAITIPNFNEILAGLKGVPHWLRLPALLLFMKTRKIRTVRQTILGVLPEFRDRGLHAWLVLEQFRVAQNSFSDAILGWVEETNTEVVELCRGVGGETDREWGIFEKIIDR